VQDEWDVQLFRLRPDRPEFRLFEIAAIHIRERRRRVDAELFDGPLHLADGPGRRLHWQVGKADEAAGMLLQHAGDGVVVRLADARREVRIDVVVE
jgi:hypothetical protein